MIEPVVLGDCTLYLGDCLEVLPTLAAGSIDAVVTDPPYNFDSRGGGLYADHHHLDTIRDSFGDDYSPDKFLPKILDLFGRNLCIWHSQKLLKNYIDFAENNSLNWDLMFWHKTNAMPNYGGKLMSDTEYCIRIFRAGDSYIARGLNHKNYRKYYIDNVQPNNGHPTPKPLPLIKKQVVLFSRDGDTVLDPFLGSGTTGVACVQTGRKFIGIEIDPHYFDIAVKRIKQAQLQIRMEI